MKGEGVVEVVESAEVKRRAICNKEGKTQSGWEASFVRPVTLYLGTYY